MLLGAVARDANDFLVYNQATGTISFDADADGSGAAVVVAIVAAGTQVQADEFILV